MTSLGSFLDNNDLSPELEFKIVSGNALRLAPKGGHGWRIVLFYCGDWCHFCQQQLADFQALLKDFEAEQTTVIAGSADPIEKAKELVNKIGIPFPVGYGLNAEEISRVTGAFYEKEKKFLHPTGFLIRPDNKISDACYCSGSMGHLVARDTLHLVRSYKDEKEEALGFLIRHLGSIP